MKRVTLLAERIESEGTSYRIYPTGSKGALCAHARHVLSVQDADARDFAPPAPPAAGSVLTTAELDALPVGAVVDATVTGTRVRAMASETREWHMSAYLDGLRRRAMASETREWHMSAHLDGSRVALSRDLKDAVFVTDAPIQPAPIKPLPLPTEPGARFWGRTSGSEPTWWFAHSVGFHGQSGEVRYVSSAGRGVPSQGIATHGLVRLPDPDASDVTA